MLRNKLVAIFQRHGSRWDPKRSVREQDLWDEHARFVDALYEAGKVVLAGPYADESGSLVVLDVGSAEEARRIFAEDPWARSDILVAEAVKEWTIFLDREDRRAP